MTESDRSGTQYSEDLQWWWTGTEWIPASQAPSPPPPPAQSPTVMGPPGALTHLSPDGNFYWDGARWIPAQDLWRSQPGSQAQEQQPHAIGPRLREIVRAPSKAILIVPSLSRTRFATQLLAYVFLLLVAVGGPVLATQVMDRGGFRPYVFAVFLLMAYAVVAWIVASRPAAVAVIVTRDGVWWRDQRLREDFLELARVANIQKRCYRLGIGQTRCGAWLVNVDGRAQFKLGRSIRAAHLAQALGVQNLEWPEVLSRAQLENLLPGSTDVARQGIVWKWVVPVGVGLAAVALDRLI